MMYLTNALSLNMLPRESLRLELHPVSVDEARALAMAGVQSAIGHADTARILSGMLGIEVAVNRVDVHVAPEDRILVAQYSGPRLPEGTTTLPAGARILFWLVKVENL